MIEIDEKDLLTSIEDIRKEIIKFNQSEEFQKLATFFEHKTFYEILSISRKENIHSSFLGWLFNPEESHGLGEYPLKKFLECIIGLLNDGLQKNFLNSLPKEFVNSIITGSYDLNNIILEMEKVIDSQSRFDIYIEADLKYDDLSKLPQKIKIVIENKVKAKEHNQQTTRYYKWLEDNNSENLINIPVFLSPITNIRLLELSEPECSHKKFVQINYQFLLDYLFKPCLSKDLSPQARFLIQEYIRNLSVPSLVNNNDDKGELIMAIREEESELLKLFWKKHKKLLLSAFYAFSTDSNQEPDERLLAEEIVNSQTGSKNYSTLQILLNGEVVKEDIKKTDIGKFIVTILIEKNKLNQENFLLLSNDKSSSFKLLKEKEEITESESKYKRYKLNDSDKIDIFGKTYFVSGNWGNNNWPKFNQFIQNNFPGMEIKMSEL